MPKAIFVIERSSSAVFKIQDGGLYDEINNEEYDYEESTAFDNDGFSEIPHELYVQYIRDHLKMEANKKFQAALNAFADVAITLNEAWSAVDALNIVHTPTHAKYPFHKDFSELTLDILTWQEQGAKFFNNK